MKVAAAQAAETLEVATVAVMVVVVMAVPKARLGLLRASSIGRIVGPQRSTRASAA